jgi:hypothetical protein
LLVVKQQSSKPKPFSPNPFKRPEVVEVEWVDTMGYSGWNDRRERLRVLDSVEEMDHISTGYVLKRAPKYIALTQSIGRAGSIGDTIQIPRSAVRRVTVLRKATDS